MQAKLLEFLIFVINFGYSALPSAQSTYGETINQWLPVILIAAVAALTIVGIVYAIGSAFNVPKLKTYASSEIPQVIATLIFSFLVISILEFGSGLLISFENSIIKQADLRKVCSTINEAHNSFSFLTPSNIAAYGLDAIYGIAMGFDSATPSICHTISNYQGREPYYFLASSEIILLNNTARLINFSNSIYILHAVLSFFSKLESGIEVGPVEISYSLFKGFDPLASAVKGIEQDIIGYISFNFISIMFIFFIYKYWLNLLVAGILLRTFSFTRKLGGFLMAFVISTIFIMPLTYFLTYSIIIKLPPASMNPNPTACNIPQGIWSYSSRESCEDKLTPLSLQCPAECPTLECVPCGNNQYCPECVSTSSQTQTTPTKSESLAYQGFRGCFADPYSGILGWEIKQFLSNLLTPIVALPTVGIGYVCNIDTATAYVAYLGSSQFIGRLAVETYLPPLISFFVTFANIIGLSTLFGGTTRILGLEKLVS